MSNFLEDIMEALDGQIVEACKIFSPLQEIYLRDGTKKKDPRDKILSQHIGISLNAGILELLDYEYRRRGGGDGSLIDCHNILIWTANNVYYIHEYDGSVEIRSVERNP